MKELIVLMPICCICIFSSAAYSNQVGDSNIESKQETNEEGGDCIVDQSTDFEENEYLQNGIWLSRDDIAFPNVVNFSKHGRITLVYNYGNLGSDSYYGSYRVLDGRAIVSSVQREYYPLELSVEFPRGEVFYNAIFSIERSENGESELKIAFLDDSDEDFLLSACRVSDISFRSFLLTEYDASPSENPVPSEPENPVPSEPENPVPSEPENPVPSEPENPVPSEPENPAPSEPENPAPSNN